MASTLTPADPSTAKRPFDYTRLRFGLASYLVPGLGQIWDGRYAKGVLFFVCIYTLFFYGSYIGSGSVKDERTNRTYRSGNVYLPAGDPPEQKNAAKKPGGFDHLRYNLVNRWQFVGQFWVGVAAWPALFQYYYYDNQAQERVERLYYDAHVSMKKAEEKGENADEELKKAQDAIEEAKKLEPSLALPVIGTFQREPSQASINAVQNASDKRLELGWVFTVIAGVLNLLVIYDAVVGPAAHNEKKAS